MSDLNVCRVCLDPDTDEDMARLFANGGKLANELFIISGINLVELVDYDVPALICKNCVKELKIAIKFRTRVKTSDKGYFRNLTAKAEDIWNEKFAELRNFEAPIEQSKFLDDIYIKCEVFEKATSVIDKHPEASYKGNEHPESDHDMDFNDFDGGNDAPMDDESDYWPEEDNKEETIEHKFEPMTTTLARPKRPKKSPSDLHCPACNKVFDTRRMFTYHEETAHVNHPDAKFECTVCKNKFLVNKGLAWHMRNVHPNVSFDCKECPKKFTTPLSLERHMDIRHRQLEYSCEFCGKIIHNRRKMQKHLYTHKRKKVDSTFTKEDDEPLVKRENRPVPEDYVEAVIKEASENNETENEPEIEPETNGNQCHICQKLFRSKASKECHLKTQHNYKVSQIFTCGHCKKQFPVYRAFIRHKNAVHKKHGLPECSECGKMFSTVKILEHHMETSHKTEHYCEKCGKVYETRRKWQKHMYAHRDREMGKPKRSCTDTTEYTCECCSKVFQGRHNLTKHLYRKRKKMQMNQQTNQQQDPPAYGFRNYNSFQDAYN